MKRLILILVLGLTAGLLVGCGEPEEADTAAAETIETGGQALTGTNEDGPSVAAMDTPGAGGGMGGGGRRARSGPAILGREDVQGELGLSEDQIAHLDEIIGSDGEPAEIEQHLGDVLSEEQLDRYRQLNLQREGYNAMTKPVVAEELELTEEQLAGIEEANEAARPQRGEGGFDREAFMKLQDARNEAIQEILTDDQKEKWAEMLGEHFEFARRQFGGGGNQETPR